MINEQYRGIIILFNNIKYNSYYQKYFNIPLLQQSPEIDYNYISNIIKNYKNKNNLINVANNLSNHIHTLNSIKDINCNYIYISCHSIMLRNNKIISSTYDCLQNNNIINNLSNHKIKIITSLCIGNRIINKNKIFKIKIKFNNIPNIAIYDIKKNSKYNTVEQIIDNNIISRYISHIKGDLIYLNGNYKIPIEAIQSNLY